jgi:hypothetical protein
MSPTPLPVLYVIACGGPPADLARHPAFPHSLALLREWGVTVLLDPNRLPRASEQPPVFPWEDLRAELLQLGPDRRQHQLSGTDS